MIESAAQSEAQRLLQAHAERAPYTALLAGRGDAVAFAYDIQDELVAAWRAQGQGQIVGWKIGMTTAHMQTLTGLPEPASGAILQGRDRSRASSLPLGDFVHLGLEGEIAVCVADAFPETEPVPAALALSRLDRVAAALEVTDDRHADWTQLDAPSLIADNIWNMGMVLGPPSPAASHARLIGRRGVLTINGAERATGMSEDIGCDPLDIVAWLGAHLARRGQPLQPGQWILTGSFVPTTFPQAGDRYGFAVEGLAPVEISVV